jgi:hypothetical protein
VIAWLWTVKGHPQEPRGVCGKLGKAQAAAEKCLTPQTTAIVESALVIDDPVTGRHRYERTGRYCTATLIGNRACWTELAMQAQLAETMQL